MKLLKSVKDNLPDWYSKVNEGLLDGLDGL